MVYFRAWLCLLITVAVTATSAPPPKPKEKSKGPWHAGWHKPVDPLKDCQFDRDGDKLTITIPDGDHRLDYGRAGDQFCMMPNCNAPMLTREVEGDFDVVVRVTSNLSTPLSASSSNYSAGLLLLDGNKVMEKLQYYTPAGSRLPEYLKMERRGDTVWVRWSKDGEKWKTEGPPMRPNPPKKVTLAITASSAGLGIFKAEFDKFKLTLHEKNTK
jgi:regulation of enolase protein 1 (concanavalin A-like superfamily)